MIRPMMLLSLLLTTLGAFAACAPALAPPGGASGQPTAVADRVVLEGARAFAVAELAYLTTAGGVERLVDRGVIRGETATWVRARNSEARVLLLRGKATADAAERARVAAQLLGLAQRFDDLLKGR